jgi:hypothetical protein
MRKGGRSGIGRWVMLGAGVAFAGFVFYSLFTVEPVKVVRSHLEHDGDTVFVSGEVRNTADHPRAIDLEVHYYDHNGRPIGQDSIVLDELGAGAVRDFKSPPRPIAGVEDFSLYMNNGRNPYGN